VKWVRPALLVPLLLVAAILACSPGAAAEPTATPLPRPTQKPQATATKAEVVEPTSTKAPKATRTPKPEATDTEAVVDNPITLSAEAYAHPSGAFTITLPEGWTLDERDNSIYVSEPDNIASAEVSYTNVGVVFDLETLQKYIDAVEANWFATFDNYVAADPALQNDGSTLVAKNLDFDGTPQTVWSYYWQDGTVIYEQDFWVNSDDYDAYVSGLLDVANSMTTDASAGAKVDPYRIVYEFKGPNDLFTFNVPYPWNYIHDTGENSITDRFESPDGQSFVENITYDDGTTVSKSESGAFTRVLLKEYYGVNDIKVTDDQVQSDGSERLDWYSPAGGLDGVSFFETRGTTFLLLTWIVNTESYDLYFPVWDTLVGSYTIPQ
jgi:hypothetical protein